MSDAHTFYMQAALEQAQQAAAEGEVPIGAVVVAADGRIVGRGRNRPVASHDPTAHAEVMALRAAAAERGNYRLDGCTLYVTLEPCTMCAGAMLHARLARVVYAVAEPRTGAAGSVINPFAVAQINHHTEAVPASALGEQGGRWAQACAELLQAFFKARRQARQQQHPLRDDALRTEPARFAATGLPNGHSRFVSTLPSLGGLRLHYLDAAAAGGSGEAAARGLAWLLLHGHPGWSLGCTRTLERLLRLPATARVVVPDLPGFGLSDKPKKAAWHTPAAHRAVLAELVTHLGLSDVVLVGHGVGADLARALPGMLPGRIRGMWLMGQHDDPPAPGKSDPRQAYACSHEFFLDLSRRKLDRSMDKQGVRSATLAPEAFSAPWPDVGHQAAFAGVAAWYRPGGPGAPPAPSWLAAPPAGAGPILDGGTPSSPWTQPDEGLPAEALARAAAYFTR